MRIVKISVKKLFGVYDHEIPLNQESRITILHGPNGVGKTIVLTMLNGLFNANYLSFREVKFEEFRVCFDTDECLAVTKCEDGLRLRHKGFFGTETAMLDPESKGEPEWLADIKRQVQVQLIKTQRLQTEVAIQSEAAQVGSRGYTQVMGLAVDAVSSLLASRLQNVLDDSQIDQDLNQIEVLLGGIRSRIAHSHMLDELEASEVRKQLDHINSLIDLTVKRRDDSEITSHRLMLLVGLLNGHFDLKRVFTDAERGLLFLSPDGDLIPVGSLSSGEQHLLVLFFTLLFDVPNGSLVLVDEPELSFHVTWQREFLDDLRSIVSLVDIDVVLATHSPQLINEKWNWMVDMRNPLSIYDEADLEYAG